MVSSSSRRHSDTYATAGASPVADIYIYIYVLEEGPPVGKHVLGSIFSNRRGEGEDTFLLCDQVLLADFLDFQMLFLVGWSARVFWRGVVFRIFRVSPENPGRGGAHSACFS